MQMQQHTTDYTTLSTPNRDKACLSRLEHTPISASVSWPSFFHSLGTVVFLNMVFSLFCFLTTLTKFVVHSTI